MPETVARLVPFLRPSRRQIRVRAIADASFELGRAAGDAEGYERGLRDRGALAEVARQPAPPECEAART